MKEPHEPPSTQLCLNSKYREEESCGGFSESPVTGQSVHVSPFLWERVCFAWLCGNCHLLQQGAQAPAGSPDLGAAESKSSFFTRNQNGRARAGTLGYLSVCGGGSWGVGGGSSHTSQLKACGSSWIPIIQTIRRICEARRSKFSVFPGRPTSSSRLEPLVSVVNYSLVFCFQGFEIKLLDVLLSSRDYLL